MIFVLVKIVLLLGILRHPLFLRFVDFQWNVLMMIRLFQKHLGLDLKTE